MKKKSPKKFLLFIIPKVIIVTESVGMIIA